MNSDLFWVKPSTWSDPVESDLETITEQLGKKPRGDFQVVVRDNEGNPSVIENAPFFYDGTPMPTRYWLVDSELIYFISKLESTGAVKQVQTEIAIEDIAIIHDRYQAQRDVLILPDFQGPRPSAGVGGTRKGVKCLHTHVAHYLATNDDIVGEWAMEKVNEMREEIK